MSLTRYKSHRSGREGVGRWEACQRQLFLITHLLSTMGTETAGFFFSPSMMSRALSPYILCMALRWMTSEVPPSVLSSRNLACSSADMRESFFCTDSSTRIVARLVSKTTSNCRWTIRKEEIRHNITYTWQWFLNVFLSSLPTRSRKVRLFFFVVAGFYLVFNLFMHTRCQHLHTVNVRKNCRSFTIQDSEVPTRKRCALYVTHSAAVPSESSSCIFHRNSISRHDIHRQRYSVSCLKSFLEQS